MADHKDGGITLKTKHIVIIIILIILLLIGAVTVGINWNNWFGDKTPETPAISQSELDIDPNAGDYSGVQPEDKGGEAKGIKIPGYPSITLPADTKDVTVALLNPEGNRCYFKFELVLKESGETLYTSKLVPPGKCINNITLSKPLSAGEYAAVIRISTTSLEDGTTPMNGANVDTVLIVK